MRMPSLNLHAFYVAARLGHFTHASKELHITQSALSQRIAKLEQELETTLFIRDKKNLRLTESGEKLLRYCQVSEALENEFLEKLTTTTHEYAGSIHIGCFSSVGRSLIIPAMKPLLTKHPKLSFHLYTEEVPDLLSLLSSSAANYIITTEENQPLNELECHFLGYEENVLVKAKSAPKNPVYLDHDKEDPTTRNYFKQNHLRFSPQQHHYLDDVYGLIEGVKQGLGLAVLPLHLIQQEKV